MLQLMTSFWQALKQVLSDWISCIAMLPPAVC
jgi:hypothetical protein